MSKSEDVWSIIEEQIINEELIDADQLSSVQQRVLAGRVTVEDWSHAIENTLFQEEENGE